MRFHVLWAATSVAALQVTAAQAAVPPDVPAGHWAYGAVEELANKGLITGYPDEKFLGDRTLTRYEMAALLQRVLRRLEEPRDQKTAAPAPAPQPPAPVPQAPANAVTQDDLASLQKLVDEFKVELAVMGTDLAQAKSDIAALQARVNSLEKTVGNIGDKVGTMDQDVQTLKKNVQVSGYIQSRYENSSGIFKPGTGTSGNFYIRRGRLKVTKVGDKADFVFQFGGEQQNAFTLRDAIAVWKLRAAPKGTQPTQLWFGQFNVPFGYEIERSDADAEFPERSIAENALFPAERDRGARFLHGFSNKLWFDASLLNGGGINAPFTDDRFKDFTARIKASPAKWWNVGVSGYWGHAAQPGTAATPAVPGTVVYDTDTNGDGVINPSDTPTFVAGKPSKAAVPGFKARRDRLGVDTQLAIGKGTARWEGYWGRQPTATLAHPDVKIFGWRGEYVYPITLNDLLGLRYDTYDPDRDASDDKSARWNTAWNHLVSKNLKLTASYEWFPTVPKGFEKTNKWTFQAQTRF